MKSLILVRHAKSSWDDASVPDFERPLNERGKKDAPEMAKRLRHQKVKIDAIISSPAKRAKRTAKEFAKEYNIDKEEIIYEEKLYMASESAFLDVIKNAKNKFDHIAIFSHNPGITEFANSLTDSRIDNMPTCSVFAVNVDTNEWERFEEVEKRFWFFDFPKNGKD